jgi:hypothetical protein
MTRQETTRRAERVERLNHDLIEALPDSIERWDPFKVDPYQLARAEFTHWLSSYVDDTVTSVDEVGHLARDGWAVTRRHLDRLQNMVRTLDEVTT